MIQLLSSKLILEGGKHRQIVKERNLLAGFELHLEQLVCGFFEVERRLYGEVDGAPERHQIRRRLVDDHTWYGRPGGRVGRCELHVKGNGSVVKANGE